MGADRLALALALMDRATWVQARLDQAAAYGVDQHEETLTQSLLLDLRVAVPELNVRTFTRQEENRASGADWLWWWRGRDRWFAHLVQAKRLTEGSGGKAGYSVGYRPSRRSSTGSPAPLQIDTLLSAAGALGVPAVYALYNPSRPGERLTPGCLAVPRGSSAEGVTLVSADVMRYLLTAHTDVTGSTPRTPTRLTLDEVAQDARAWSCLATCEQRMACSWPPLPAHVWRTLGFDEQPEVDDLALGAAVAVLLARQSARGRQLLLQGADADALAQSVAQGVRTAPPRALQMALDEEELRRDSEDLFEEHPDSVQGIVVLQRRSDRDVAPHGPG